MAQKTKAADLAAEIVDLRQKYDDLLEEHKKLQASMRAPTTPTVLAAPAGSAASGSIAPAQPSVASARKEPKKEDVLQAVPKSFAQLMAWVERAKHQITWLKLKEGDAESWFVFLAPAVQALVSDWRSSTANELLNKLLVMSGCDNLHITICEQRRRNDESMLAFVARAKGYLDLAALINVPVDLTPLNWATMLRADKALTVDLMRSKACTMKEIVEIAMQEQVAMEMQESSHKTTATAAATSDEEQVAVASEKWRNGHGSRGRGGRGRGRGGRPQNCRNCSSDGHLMNITRHATGVASPATWPETAPTATARAASGMDIVAQPPLSSMKIAVPSTSCPLY